MSRAAPPVTWRPGEPVSAEKLNRMLAEGIREITVGPGLKMIRSPGGRVVISRIENDVPRATDYSVYLSSTHANGGEYTGYCFRSLPLFAGAPSPSLGTPCHIINDDEWHLVGGSVYGQTPTHWAFLPCYSVGRFDGEYTTDTPPKPIIHVSNLPYVSNTGGAGTSPWFTGQTWLREGPSVGAPSLASPTAQIGDYGVRLFLATSQDATTKVCKFRAFEWDKGGRLFSISAEA